MKPLLKFVAAFGIAFVTMMSAWNAMALELDPRLPPEGSVVNVRMICLSPTFIEALVMEKDQEAANQLFNELLIKGFCAIGEANIKILTYVQRLKDFDGDDIWIADIEMGDRVGYTFVVLQKGREA